MSPNEIDAIMPGDTGGAARTHHRMITPFVKRSKALGLRARSTRSENREAKPPPEEDNTLLLVQLETQLEVLEPGKKLEGEIEPDSVRRRSDFRVQNVVCIAIVPSEIMVIFEEVAVARKVPGRLCPGEDWEAVVSAIILPNNRAHVEAVRTPLHRANHQSKGGKNRNKGCSNGKSNNNNNNNNNRSR